MRYRSSTLISGALAFGIYITIILVLLFYFNTRNTQKSVHFVKKNEQRISVAISAPSAAPQKKTQKAVQTKKQKKKAEKPKPKPVEKPIEKPKPKPVEKPIEKPKPTEKPIDKPKPVEKKEIKKETKKVVKRDKDLNVTKPKKTIKAKDLFASVSSHKKADVSKPMLKANNSTAKAKKNNLIKVSDKPSASDIVSDSLKNNKNSDSGIENAYLARIEEKLKGWPAQSEYAGETAKVSIIVDPSGHFEFKIITASGNNEFNEGLQAYLEQLQRIGFGRHKGDRAYDLDVDFVAKE